MVVDFFEYTNTTFTNNFQYYTSMFKLWSESNPDVLTNLKPDL